jgi:hypothetical protein
MANGVYEHRFSPPLDLGGRTCETVEFDFGALTGEDCEAAARACGGALFEETLAVEFSQAYHAALAARAGKIVPADMKRVPARDYVRIAAQARNFILGLA